MFNVRVFVFLLLLGPGLSADDSRPNPSQEPITPVLPAIQFPVIGTATLPVVTPIPGSVPLLTPGNWYVVTSDSEFFLLASPAERVVITYEEGPLKLRGLFADGPGKIETRTFKAKYLAIVDAAEGQSGRVELIAVPKAVAAETDITRQLIDIGVAPQPPPVVIVPDPPKPPVPVVPTGFRVMMVYETSVALPRDIETTINSTKIREYLKAKCVKSTDGTPEFRVWDKDVTISANESPTIREMWNAAKPLITGQPQLIVAVNGDVKVYPMPANETETLKFLKTQGGE